MGRCLVIAFNAPMGQGTAQFEDGKLSGDSSIIELAQSIDQVVPQEPGPPVPVDWSNALHVARALYEGALRAYGEPIEMILPLTGDDLDLEDAPENAVF